MSHIHEKKNSNFTVQKMCNCKKQIRTYDTDSKMRTENRCMFATATFTQMFSPDTITKIKI